MWILCWTIDWLIQIDSIWVMDEFIFNSIFPSYTPGGALILRFNIELQSNAIEIFEVLNIEFDICLRGIPIEGNV